MFLWLSLDFIFRSTFTVRFEYNTPDTLHELGTFDQSNHFNTDIYARIFLCW